MVAVVDEDNFPGPADEVRLNWPLELQAADTGSKYNLGKGRSKKNIRSLTALTVGQGGDIGIMHIEYDSKREKDWRMSV